jgi:hypothetical protein
MARDDSPAAGGGPGECGGREYLYGICATCHLKVHISTYLCPRCKNRITWNANRKEWVTGVVYYSRNPEDRLYGMRLCSVAKCIVCEEALLGNPCRYEMCYGTGRGECEKCGKYENRRYRCCQEAQREEAAIEEAMRNDPEWWKKRHDG